LGSLVPLLLGGRMGLLDRRQELLYLGVLVFIAGAAG
jgi:hypothetical protein